MCDSYCSNKFELELFNCEICGACNDEDDFNYYCAFTKGPTLLFQINKNFTSINAILDKNLYDDEFAFLTFKAMINYYGSNIPISGESNIRNYIKSILVLS